MATFHPECPAVVSFDSLVSVVVDTDCASVSRLGSGHHSCVCNSYCVVCTRVESYVGDSFDDPDVSSVPFGTGCLIVGVTVV